MVACGESHTMAILVDTNNNTKNGSTKVCTWGRGDMGALGMSDPPISLGTNGPYIVVSYPTVFFLCLTNA